MASHSASQQTRRILVVAPEGVSTPELRSAFPDSEFRIAASVEDALAILDSEPIDQVVTGASDLPALARGARAADAPRVFDDMVQPVGIVQQDGKLIWRNARLGAYPESVAEALRQQCQTAFEGFAAEIAEGKK